MEDNSKQTDDILSQSSNLDFRDYGAYDKNGYVYAIISPTAKPESIQNVKKFTNAEEAQKFIEELTFLRYSFKGSFKHILLDNDFMSDVEQSSNQLGNKPYTNANAAKEIERLILKGKLLVFLTGEWVPSEVRNHNQTPKSEKSSSVAGHNQSPHSLGPSTSTENDSSALSQPGGLKATEGARVTKSNGTLSNPTHPLNKHGPDVSNDYVENRVQKELIDKGRSGVRTKFDDRAVMESTIADTINANDEAISNWLNSNPRTGVPKAFEYNPDIGNIGTGFEVSADGTSVVKVTKPLEKVKVVLIPDGNGKYFIHTAHPF